MTPDIKIFLLFLTYLRPRVRLRLYFRPLGFSLIKHHFLSLINLIRFI